MHYIALFSPKLETSGTHVSPTHQCTTCLEFGEQHLNDVISANSG